MEILQFAKITSISENGKNVRMEKYRILKCQSINMSNRNKLEQNYLQNNLKF